MITISASVGKGGVNKREDVGIVQAMLNKYMLPPRRLLDITGICDDNLIDAITDFQRRNMNSPAPDGKVDPGGGTFRALNGQPASAARPIGKVSSSVGKPAAMRQSAWDYLLAFTVRHEGAVLHMYNNRRTEAAAQDVTCGIGVLLPSADAAARADIMALFYDPATKSTPTPEQMRADWDAASQLLRTGTNLADYGDVCHMRMYPDRVIDKMATIMRDQKLPPLLRIKEYAGFQDMPAAAQAFCLSFAYGHMPTDYPRMNASIVSGDWQGASGQCRLTGAAELKNQAHTNLLLFAQKVVDQKLDLDTVPASAEGI